MADYELDKLLVQVRRIEEHREKGAEKEIRETYQKLLKELRYYLADEYTRYAEADQLTYGILQQHGAYARFLEEVEQKINDISPETKRLIRSTVEQTYETTYNGLIECVKQAASGIELGNLKACTPDVMRRAVENPISKLTLNDRLEKHRKEIVYDIKQNISVGLMNGDRYSTMSKRISQSVEGNYKKAIRIARTETHRVREAGNQDAAMSVDEVLKTGESGMRMAKTWHTMKDERVRPAKAKGKNRKYDHRKMDGITIPVDEEFTLPGGAKTTAPGQSGVAGEDINCRCYASHGLVRTAQTGSKSEIVYKNESVYYDKEKDYSVHLEAYNDDVNRGISKAIEDVAKKGSADRYEHMHLVDLKTGDLVFYETNGEPDSVGYKFWDIVKKNPDKNFAFIHNHNIISSLSETDLQTAVTTPNIPVMIAVQNNGVKYIAERQREVQKNYYPDVYFEKELNELNKLSRDGKITPAERTNRREEIIVQGLLRDFFRKR